MSDSRVFPGELNIPSLDDLIRFGQVEQAFMFPGKDGMHEVRLKVLEHHELLAAMSACGSAQDVFRYPKVLQVEILWRSILSIDKVDYSNADPGNHQKLRLMLERSSTPTVDLLWQCYENLRDLQTEVVVGQRLEEIKGKYGTLDFLTLSPPDGEESGGFLRDLGLSHPTTKDISGS